jgi:hypothetical protein
MTDWQAPPPGGQPAAPIAQDAPAWSPAPATPATGPWRSNRGLSIALLVLFIVTAAVLLIEIAVAFNLRSVMHDFADGDASFREATDAIDGFAGVVALDFFVLRLALGVLFIIWMFRAAKNHELLDRPATTFGPGWAIGAWFIPVAFLVIPIIQLQQLWKGADPSTPRGDPTWKERPASPLLWLWWLLFAGGFVANVVSRFLIDDDVDSLSEDLEQLDTAVVVFAIVTAITVAAAIVGIFVVRQLTARQAEAAQVLGVPAVGATGYGVAATPQADQPAAPASWTPPGAGHAPPPDMTAGWKPDPVGRWEYRYWDGSQWTEHVSRGGQQATDHL